MNNTKKIRKYLVKIPVLVSVWSEDGERDAIRKANSMTLEDILESGHMVGNAEKIIETADTVEYLDEPDPPHLGVVA